MKLTERSYSGKLFIPRPIIHEDKSNSILIILTGWGNPEGTKKALGKMQDFLEVASQDEDVTSPFDRIEGLSKTANNLRISLLLANEYLNKDFNQEEYQAGFEAICVQKQNSEVSLLTIGSYIPYVIKKNALPTPLMYQLSLSHDFEKKQSLAPLPGQLAGVSNNLNINIQSFRNHKAHELLIINRTSIPSHLFQNWNNSLSLDEVALSLAKSDAEQPFWLCKINLEE